LRSAAAISSGRAGSLATISSRSTASALASAVSRLA
jgi:hypothetical protein